LSGRQYHASTTSSPVELRRGAANTSARGARLRREGHLGIAHASLRCNQQRSRPRFGAAGNDVISL
jgi:hypothetical protein